MTLRYAVKCDSCKATIRETDDVRESYAGVTCDDFRRQVLSKTPAQANANKRRHQYIHRRDPETNERSGCGATDGAASLNRSDVNCPHPRCRFEVSL